MTDELMLIFGDDGIAREYKDDFDITIHCETKEEQEEVWKRLAQDDWTPCVECNVSTETFVDGDRNLEALLAAIAVWNRRMEDGD